MFLPFATASSAHVVVALRSFSLAFNTLPVMRRCLSAASTTSPPSSVNDKACKIAVIGSGWAGYSFLSLMKYEHYHATCVSPRNYFLFTPLLAGSAVGTIDFRCIVESVRSLNPKHVDFIKATCEDVNFERRVLLCKSSIDSNSKIDTFEVPYDALVLAPGAQSNTFGIEGVKEYAMFLKDVNDARKIRARIIDCFDLASRPGISSYEVDSLLHFQVVGGGPTGVEFTGELHDFITDDLYKAYPKIAHRARVTLYEVAPRILGAFDGTLASYTTSHFERRGVTVRTGTKVDKITPTELVINGGQRVPFGMLVWAAGVTQLPFVRKLTGRICEDPRKAGRLITDGQLRLLGPDKKPMPGVYALGDCSTIIDLELPPTAQVASQKGEYLAKGLCAHSPFSKALINTSSENLNRTQRFEFPEFRSDFAYKHAGSMAYIGGSRAVIQLGRKNNKVTGLLAWMMWRATYMSKSKSLRNMFCVPISWLTSWMFGRELSRFN